MFSGINVSPKFINKLNTSANCGTIYLNNYLTKTVLKEQRFTIEI